MELPATDASPAATQPASLTEQVKALQLQGKGVTEIAKLLNKPTGTVAPIMSRVRAEQRAFQSGTQAQASNALSQTKTLGIQGGLSVPKRSARPISEDKRARVGALRLLNRVRAGKAGISKDRITAATTILGKIKAASEDDAASKTVYSTMGDEELAEHVITSAAASIGVVKLREVLDRLQREGTLIKSPGEHGAEAAGLGGVVQGGA